eukprot:scaffold312_cov409-Pavlova_lutheri.AAC.19
MGWEEMQCALASERYQVSLEYPPSVVVSVLFRDSPQGRWSRRHVAPSPLATPVLPRLSFDDEEYALNREAFERFSIIFGPFTWDLFASPNNAQCPAFFTRETNALAQEWA